MTSDMFEFVNVGKFQKFEIAPYDRGLSALAT